MRVSLDARFVGLPGIGRMIDGLWAALLELGVEIVGLSAPAGSLDYMGALRPPPAGPHLAVGAPPYWPQEQLALPRAITRLRADVHHATFYAFPHLTRTPVVLTVHDLFPYLQPEITRSRAAAAVYRVIVPAAIRRARIVVAVSEFTARQISETFGIGAGRLRVITHGIEHERFRAAAQDVQAVRHRHRLPPEYLLYVGSAKPNKNLGTLLAAHRPSHPPLVLAGAGPADLTAAGLPEADTRRVLALGRVPDADLAALYSGALALLLPSLYEGAGFTPLEAMAAGTPVVSSHGGALQETVGDAGLLVSPLDVGGWTEAITRVAEQEQLRRQLVRRGAERVRGRTWAEAARQYLAVYREAAA